LDGNIEIILVIEQIRKWSYLLKSIENAGMSMCCRIGISRIRLPPPPLEQRKRIFNERELAFICFSHAYILGTVVILK